MADYFKLSDENLDNQARMLAENPRSLLAARVAVYTMIGGGILGRSAIQNPASFYIDTRVSRRPYSVKAIYQAVEILKRAYAILGLAGWQEHLDILGNMPNLGVF